MKEETKGNLIFLGFIAGMMITWFIWYQIGYDQAERNILHPTGPGVQVGSRVMIQSHKDFGSQCKITVLGIQAAETGSDAWVLYQNCFGKNPSTSTGIVSLEDLIALKGY